MRLGLQVERFDFPGGNGAIGPTLGRIGRDADDAGVSSLWVMDHLFQIGHNGPPEDPMLEAYTALAFLAGQTTRITLGSLVTAAIYRYPGVLVKTVTSLDVLSGGRAWLGIGAAWNEAESKALGIPFPPLGERFERLEETLRIAHAMWSGDESPIHGTHYQLERPLDSPPSIQRPHPPILIGGGGEQRTFRLIARYADACNLFAPNADYLKGKLSVLRERCDEVGRPWSEIEKTALKRLALDPGGDVAQQALDQLAPLAELGIDHAIVQVNRFWEPGAVERLADVVAAVGPLVPAGR